MPTMDRPDAPDARRWSDDPVECGSAAGFGVYLHVPFCTHRCGYCDFATDAVGTRDPDDRASRFARYTDALVADLRAQVAAGPRGLAPPDAAVPERWRTVTSIFVGGGTPTLLGAGRLGRILGAVHAELDVAADAEVTVECNPETASVELFAGLATAGVTRVSMGAQSFAPHVLSTLERGHTADRPVQAVAEARAGGIPEVSLDLIYGTPGESDGDWAATLDAVVAAGVDHVSAYALTIHADTPFGRAIGRGAMSQPDEDAQRDRFDHARTTLAAAGFDHYEVSNWSRGPAQRSRHNVLYWRHGDYLGVGVGAHAHLDGRRWWTTRSTDRYLREVAAGHHEPAGAEVLDDAERAVERLLLGLRLREGLHPTDVPPLDPLALEDALSAGLVETACGRLRCTEHGWFLLDEAVARLAP
ncbi:radical SAM family heme chaperone HemW [Nitriliruptoraceae bacterium ZYF776]|nr:radical SAM family heme chaperone HemW [Profundirhabdus halotolerans]